MHASCDVKYLDGIHSDEPVLFVLHKGVQAKLLKPIPELVVQPFVLGPDGLQTLLSNNLQGLPHSVADRDQCCVVVDPLVLAEPAPCQSIGSKSARCSGRAK